MTRSSRLLAALAAALGFVAVAAGAFAAHAISDEWAKAILHTGGEYGLVSALAAYSALFLEAQGGRGARIAAWLFVAGGALFSLSLYALALSGVRWLGAITPIGGLGMLGGWAMLGWAGFSARPR